MERSQKINSLALSLQKQGFKNAVFLHTNTCFDIVARSPETSETFIIKVLPNIDSLHESQAKELKHLALLFKAKPLIIGEKTKMFELSDSTFYSRYGISAMTEKSFLFLLRGILPSKKYFKGKEISSLDTEKLSNLRKKLNLSLSDLADKLSISRETLFRYEHGSPASSKNLSLLERFFKSPLAKPITLPETESSELAPHLEDDLDFYLKKIGFDITAFQHAPFSRTLVFNNIILADKSLSKQDIQRKVEHLRDTARITNTSPILFSTEKLSLSEIPTINPEEVYSFDKARELVDYIKKPKSKK